MRLDKFLKVSRLIKRRTVAKEMCNNGRITMNGQTAKAGSNVDVGDELTIRYGQKLITVTINQVKETATKEDASSLYTLTNEKAIE